jgi:hypothetical protein
MSRSISARPVWLRAATLAALVLACQVAVSSFASAAEAPISKEQLAAARAAIEASHVTDGVDNVLLAVAQQAKTNFIRSSPSYSAQIEAAANKAAIELASQRVDIDRQIQQIWAAKFTIDELKAIATFYQSPVGQKLTRETGGLVAESAQALQAYQIKLSQDMVTKTRDELRKQGLPF